ncbi:unnamed protein product [Dovyalis caffra]|uniref:F-box domain-containing protein n=1 Tax=Dovyalis caffra TaxID=77055 RepID=A0AAV1RS97_9ROSI|nr:unnamed protein product [Dovyalis caffra]
MELESSYKFAPYILRSVFGDETDVLELLVVSVHEAFSESGLVGFDSHIKFVSDFGSAEICLVLDLLRRNCLEEDRMSEFYHLWKTVKDRIVLPFSIQRTEKTSATLPSCVMHPSSDLKLEILELLPASDVARTACVSSKMQSLCSNNDLWKQKYVDEFGYESETQSFGNWKSRFG